MNLLRNTKILYPLLILMVWVLPILFMHLDWRGISGTLPKYWQTYEWTGYLGALVLALIFANEFQIKKPQKLNEILAMAAPFLSLLPVLYQYAEYPIRSWDYDCYQIAGDKILNGESPYFGFYFYPPLLAWMISIFQKISGDAGITFFTYQYIQLLLVGALIFQCNQLIRKLNFAQINGAILLFALFVLNIPLWRTIHHNQVNLVLVNILMFSILNHGKHPVLNGIFLALGTHLKLYPIIISGIWAVKKNFKPVLWFFVSCILLSGLLEIMIPGIWIEFLNFFKKFPGGNAMRDNGFHSIIYNLLHVTGFDKGLEIGEAKTFIKSIYSLIIILVCLYFLYRFFAREYQSGFSDAHNSREKLWFQTGHIADAGAFMLLFSPMVWEHHYVLSLPLIIFSIARQIDKVNYRIWVGVFLILAMPVADIFILSLTRITGLFLLLQATSDPIPHWGFSTYSFLKKYIRHITFCIVSIFLISFVSRFDHRIFGDGHEYVLQTEAWADHGYPDIRPENTVQILNYSENIFRKDFFENFLHFQNQPIQAPPYGFVGLFFDKDNKLFGYHFPFYSLLAVPVKFILSAIGDDWLKSFAILNTLFLIITIGYVCFYSLLPKWNKISLILFIFFSPMIWYLRWPHTEVMTACLTALALLSWYDKRFFLSIWLAAFASLQNQPLAFLILLPIASYFIENNKFNLKSALNLSGSILLILIPGIFYYYHFGVSNLIIHTGSASLAYISAERIFDFFMDINQGIIAGYSVFLFAFIFLLIKWIRSRKYVQAFLFLIILGSISITAAMTINWNMGQAGISRYAVWAGMIFMIPVLAEWNFKSSGSKIFMGLTLFMQMFILSSFGMLDTDDGSCQQHNAVSKWILNGNPSLYNPVMETFQERCLKREGVLLQEMIHGPIRYVRDDGKTTKAIVSFKRLDACDFNCQGNKKLMQRFKELQFNKEGLSYIDLIDLECYPGRE